MKKSNKILIFLLALGVLASCSVKKDNFISRKYNSFTTKYNILYNGNIAFQNGLDEINEQHKDNFWKQLFIEPITFDELKIVVPKFVGNPSPGQEEEEKNLTPFEKAEEKAVKAIQLHSMNFYGKEKNSQIDEAYLLLGKSRYYTQRFIPALEAFNYIILNYSYTNVIDETRIWRAKTNIRLDNEELAIESLKMLLKGEKIEKLIKEQAHTALAMAYVKTDSVQNAIKHLLLATETREDEVQTSRNLFVLGQLYISENKKDSAAIVFQNLSNFKKAPYKFRMHATIASARVSANDSLASGLITKFQKLIKNRDNKKYLDLLYYQTALLEEERDSTNSAIVNYQKSLGIVDGDEYQKTFTYEKLGDIYFRNANFLLANSYYDSVLQVSGDRIEKRLRKIQRKHKSLAALIGFENTLQSNDSILKIVSMTKEDQQFFFEKHIEKLKKLDKEKAALQLKTLSFGSSFGNNSSKQSTNKGKWYFYNTQSLNFGKTSFLNVWGNRPLEDNWRISEKQQLTTSKDTTQAKEINVKKYALSTYLSSIPSSQTAIDALMFERNEALYQTGLIYKEQFKNPQLAIQRFERLLSIDPEKNKILPIYYHLYQLYTVTENQKATTYRKIIIDQYSASKYAQIIQYPTKKLTKETIGEVEVTYKEIYYLYKAGEFKDVVSKITEITPTIQQSKLIAKFELLKALAIGKYQEREKYKEALEYVALNYGNTEEGKRAKEILKKLK